METLHDKSQHQKVSDNTQMSRMQPFSFAQEAAKVKKKEKKKKNTTEINFIQFYY